MGCEHTKQIKAVKPSGDGCVECLKMGDEWVHLRECLSCGHVGCCDSSKNKHATKHFHGTKHPVMRSFEPGERLGLVLRRRAELARRGSGARPRGTSSVPPTMATGVTMTLRNGTIIEQRDAGAEAERLGQVRRR